MANVKIVYIDTRLNMYAVIELCKTGLYQHGEFQTKKEAEEHREYLIRAFTHYDRPGMPCQKKFEVFKRA